MFFVPSLLQCVYVYVCISASLSCISPSLWNSLWVYFSLWCFLLTFLLIFYISWTCSLSPGFFFQLSLLFQLWERLGELVIHCFISDKQCDHSQFTSLLNFKFLPCKRGQESPFYLFPWASMRRIQWDGNSSASGCHCWDFLFIRYLISITSLIPKISYSEGLYCYIPPFYWRGDWDPTGSYGLPNTTEQNLYSNLHLCHGICIKFL